jgi:hypothetical protein
LQEDPSPKMPANNFSHNEINFFMFKLKSFPDTRSLII